MADDVERVGDRRLAEALKVWFAAHALDPHAWRTPVGRVLRVGMERRGNFKPSGRGRYGPAMRAGRDRLREAWGQRGSAWD